jgi:hypothetical protein
LRQQHTPAAPQPNTSRKPAAGFVRNEFYEILSRIKADQPRRYAREVSAGTQVAVSRYEERRAEHERPTAARAAERREVEAGANRVQL